MMISLHMRFCGYLFACVFAVRNAKAEVKVERFEKFFAEVVALDHTEFPDWTATNAKNKNELSHYLGYFHRRFTCAQSYKALYDRKLRL